MESSTSGDAYTWDCGYRLPTELNDGRLSTVYYITTHDGGESCRSTLSSGRWTAPSSGWTDTPTAGQHEDRAIRYPGYAPAGRSRGRGRWTPGTRSGRAALDIGVPDQDAITVVSARPRASTTASTTDTSPLSVVTAPPSSRSVTMAVLFRGPP